MFINYLKFQEQSKRQEEWEDERGGLRLKNPRRKETKALYTADHVTGYFTVMMLKRTVIVSAGETGEVPTFASCLLADVWIISF